MNKKTKIALGIGIPVAMVVIFLLPLVVGEMNSSRVETKSGYNFYVCSGLIVGMNKGRLSIIKR